MPTRRRRPRPAPMPLLWRRGDVLPLRQDGRWRCAWCAEWSTDCRGLLAEALPLGLWCYAQCADCAAWTAYLQGQEA